MGFSAQKYRKEEKERAWKINPVWRGIGCALIIIIPIMAWFSASLVLQTNKKIPLPPEMIRPITLKYTQITQVDPIIASINRFTTSQHLALGQFMLTIFFMFIGFGILSVIYAIMLRLAGPSRYGPFDVPPSIMRK
jgi:hypothetical protein